MKRSYRRRDPSRSPKPRIVVVTEGTSTEPLYLKLFRRLHRITSVAVAVIPLGQDPRAVVERAISEREESASDADAEDDSFWAMFDRDEHSRFDEAVDLARGNDIPTAMSNPCFELWAILHYELLDAPSSRRECQRRLAELCPSYGRSGKRFEDEDAIRNSYDDAVRRARTLLDRRRNEQQPYGNPSTTVYELTEHVAQFAVESH